jgi:hypothetical protein
MNAWLLYLIRNSYSRTPLIVVFYNDHPFSVVFYNDRCCPDVCDSGQSINDPALAGQNKNNQPDFSLKPGWLFLCNCLYMMLGK